jgi:hypothetical protein
MRLETRSKARLGRIVCYAVVALVVAWSLLALAGYAILGAAGDWIASLGVADGWLASGGTLVDQVGGPVIAILWLLGMFVILGAMAVIRRFAT